MLEKFCVLRRTAMKLEVNQGAAVRIDSGDKRFRTLRRGVDRNNVERIQPISYKLQD